MAGVTIDLVDIDNARFKEAIAIYELWKEYNNKIAGAIKTNRRANLPECVSEPIAIYALNEAHKKRTKTKKNIFKWNKKTSCDAYDEVNNTKIEIKGSSSNGPTSFSPKSQFDDLVFIKVDSVNDKAEVYDTHKKTRDLYNIKVNKTQTFKDQIDQKRRPRFSVEEELIVKYKIQKFADVDLKNQKVKIY